MHSKILSWFAIVMLCALTSPATQALIISGDFSGYVAEVRTPSGPSTIGLGDPASGSFFVDTSWFAPSASSDPDSAEFFVFNVDPAVHTFSLTIDSGMGPVEDNIGAQTIRMKRKDGFDSIYLSDYYPGGFGSSLLFTGAEGSLFDTLSPDTIHAGAIDLSRSRAYQGYYLEDAGNIGSFYALTDAHITVGAVPEPDALAMMLGGLGILGVLLHRRHRVEC